MLKLSQEGSSTTIDSGTKVSVVIPSKNKLLNFSTIQYGASQGTSEFFEKDVEVLNNKGPEISAMHVEPEEGSSGSGRITVGDSIQIIGSNFTGYSGGQSNSGKPGRCKIKIEGPLYGTTQETKTVTRTNCQYEFPITTTGSYDITVTPYDNTGLKGSPISENFELYVAPKITSSLTRTGERVHFNDTIDEFTLDYAGSTGEMIAEFETGKEANYAPGSCGAIIYNQTGDVVDTPVIRKENLGNKEIKCTLDSSLSGLGLDDGMYYAKINATDSNGYELTTQRKAFYMCNNLTSEGTNWECSLADFDADGYTEGIKQPFNYSNGSHMYEMACDSCPGEKNLNVDFDGDGIDAACDPDNPNVTVGAPEKFTAYLADNNEEVVLNWSVVSEAQGYIIWYGENVSNILNINDENTNIENANITIGDTNQVSWTDTNASKNKERYYRIAAYRSEDHAFNEDSIGKYDILIKESDGSSNEEGSFISLPLIPYNNSLGNLIRNASGDPSPGKDTYHDQINAYNAEEDKWLSPKYYSGLGWYHPDPERDFDTLEVGKGYWVTKFNESYNMTVVGKVPTTNLTVPVREGDPGENDDGNLLGWNSPVKRCGLDSLISEGPSGAPMPDPDSWNDKILNYDLEKNKWFSVEYYSSPGPEWYNPDPDFEIECFKPGEAYWFRRVNKSYDWIQQRNPLK